MADDIKQEPADPAPAPAPTTDTPPPAPAPTTAGDTPPAAAPAPAPTITASDEPPKDEPKAAFGEDWRQQIAGDDDKLLKRLERYGSPKAVAEALAAAQDKIRSGQTRQPLPKDATPEQLAQWRADNGIPDSPDKYDTSLGNGHVWGDADRPLLESFTKAAHEAGMTPEAVKTALAWYSQRQAQVAEEQQLADAKYKRDNIDALIAEFGPAYRMEVRIADEFFDSLPNGLGETLLGARDANGRLLRANAEFIRWANQAQRERNPLSTVMPDGQTTAAALTTEMDKINAAMRDLNSEYYKGEKITVNGRTDTKMAHRYYELLQAQERMATGRRAA